MDAKLVYPDEYLYAADLKGKDKPLTIAKVWVEPLRIQGGAKEDKPVIRFAEIGAAYKAGKIPHDLKFVANKTNWKQLRSLLGDETDEWVGHKIVLYPTTTKFGRDTVDCIRIRERLPAQEEK